MPNIQSIQAIQVFDSRGSPTVSCEIYLSNGTSYTSMVPSGASTGSREALELRDGGDDYMGRGVQKAIENIHHHIAPALMGLDARDQQLIDERMIELDGSSAKSYLGANAILGVSLAVLGAGAKTSQTPLYQYINQVFHQINSVTLDMQLPVPMLNIINGGEHADNNIDIQEFMIMPLGASSFSEGMQWSTEIYAGLKTLLRQKNLSTGVGDEGGFAPHLQSHQEAIALIIQAIENNNLRPGVDVSIALDCAATEFYDGDLYHLKGESLKLNADEFSEYLESLSSKYPIVSIEDGMDESDYKGWKILTNALGKKCQLVGDDLFVTNVEELQRGIDESLGNSILIKFNQIGTITETMRTIHLANLNNFTSVISHRSGETEDSMIADLCVGLGTGQIKTGAPCRSDRVAKYNRLLWIEAQNKNLKFAGNVFS
ncbi:MAG: enolase [SAR86 cluster bacterium BACL1 MAG-121105-bin34]|uniref:Enolase n=2 Tax=SAR86 cluster TaxID=62672 RepID=A0A0R2UH61_9GAMM|nr:MAG: enolase [SAR86 cluster bacterium BACL1 MAG-120507-bin14]KRO41431.1 MAG: enolase [SAR86 cluster bacterium BACL1 MAG-120920-bin57]KRO96477.1 MAG: enolase [SAR86 cluster bacterium BACL1 MAG-120820-bin45]KRO96905.1 MAG: enolase [SAR86 cluster bacterium BACL1 MAG-120828-bin5]KRO99164.1 MAG: enolase [SAR86 cluster bacterium BACL1 MAG-120823-bin87]KRO99822.1 MAG: enolase [SAR86 cluster bacterium BACL1 MAG-120813-bin36]KRP01888.1 MAG: enolase [SAR86 cluster bacterium BACL1 MAG-120924-bin88]K